MFYFWLFADKFHCLPHEWAQLHPVQREWLETMAWAEWEDSKKQNQQN